MATYRFSFGRWAHLFLFVQQKRTKPDSGFVSSRSSLFSENKDDQLVTCSPFTCYLTNWIIKGTGSSLCLPKKVVRNQLDYGILVDHTFSASDTSRTKGPFHQWLVFFPEIQVSLWELESLHFPAWLRPMAFKKFNVQVERKAPFTTVYKYA